MVCVYYIEGGMQGGIHKRRTEDIIRSDDY